MSFNSKKTVANLAAGVLTMAAYIIYALSKNAPAQGDVKAWAILMLIFIGIGVAVTIAVQIVFHIVLAVSVSAKEKDGKTAKRILDATTREDERDKAISQKSSAVGYGMAGIGVFAALITLAVGGAFVLALHLIVGACALGSLFEGGMSISYYERGMHND